MSAAPKPGFWLVVRRECHWLFHDRVALLLIFGVPLFAFVVLTTVFSRPVIRGLGVTIVDEDRSDASRTLVEYVAASPSLHIVDRSGTLTTAVQDIRSGKAISAIYVPPHFERDLQAQRRPQVVGFYNQQFLTAAGIASSGLSDVLSAAKELIAPLAQFDVKELKPDMEWGTDHFDFMLEGVPTFVADQHEANYLENYHAVSDTYDKVDLPQLRKHVAEAAALAVELADLPERIGPRLTHEQIEQTMRDTHSVEMLKADGIWDDWVSGKRGREKN